VNDSFSVFLCLSVNSELRVSILSVVLKNTVSTSMASAALSRLLRLQGHTLIDSRRGLHPLVVPLARTKADDILGLLHWPSREGSISVVRTRQDSHFLQPLRSITEYSRRLAVEADVEASAASGDIIAAAAEATTMAGGKPYTQGELLDSGLKASQFMLLRVGPFADIWETIARTQQEKGDETAALIAAERASSLNPGWGCCMLLQSQLMGALRRPEEQRDLALGALESPWWTLGAPLRDAMAAAQLSHIDDLRSLVRAMEDKVREQQGAPPRTAKELSLLRATDALDEVVRTEGSWDESRAAVAAALHDAGLDAAAEVAAAPLSGEVG
jgi:hypothetical protein